MGMRILIVDDSAMMRKMIAKVLATRGGHTVVGEAKNGIEALELYKTLKPELVTMDITMDPSALILIWLTRLHQFNSLSRSFILRVIRLKICSNYSK